MPLAKAHGAALIALTIDEVGMAKTAERKVEIAQRIKEIACDEHGLEPEALIFDLLTFTLTTGDEEWRPSAVETIEGIRRVKAEIPGVKTSLGVSNVSFGVSPRPRAVLNSVFLHHCVEAGLDLAMVNPNHITPYSRDPRRRARADRRPRLQPRATTRWRSSSPTSSRRAKRTRPEAADPTAGMEPEEALHWHILRRKKDGVEEWIDSSVEKIGAVPTLNEVLLPAMKEVGDKFGAGELILPFVLQSAEVMKRAVAQLENYLDRIEGHAKGKVVIATVFGDVHDIGKSLVNTILTNNGYTRVDLGKQVPVDAIIEAAVENEADAIGLSALLVSTSKQMPTCIAELHQRGLEFPVLIGGAAINRDFGRRTLYPKGKESDEVYEPGVFYCKDAFQGLDTMDALVDAEARAALVERIQGEAKQLREKVGRASTTRRRSPTRACARRRAPTSRSRRRPSGACARSPVDLDDVYPHLDRHVLFKLHWGGKGVKGEAWRQLVEGDRRGRGLRAAAGADVARSRTTCTRGRGSATSPATPTATSWSSSTPRTPRSSSSASSSRASRSTTGSASPTSTARSTRGERDVVALQGVTVGAEVTELMDRLEAEGEVTEQYYVHGLGVQAAEGSAEWLHAEVRAELGIEPDQGRRYSWGYPACPDQSEHEQGLAPARPRRDRDDPLRRLRGDARAVDGGDHRPPPAGGLLRDEVRLHPRGEGRRRTDRRDRARRRAAAGGGAGRGRRRGGRKTRGRAGRRAR